MSEDNKNREYTVSFLLQEFGQIDSERLRLRGEAVQRLNFFLTLTSALLGGVVLFGQNTHLVEIRYVVLVALLFLSIIGWHTFDYIVGRDINTDRVIRAAARIRRYFSDSDPSIQKYLMWQDTDEPSKYVTHNDSAIRRTVEAVLSFLLAFATGSLLDILNLGAIVSVTVGIIGFAVLLIGLEMYAARRFARATQKAEAEKLHPRRIVSESRK